MYICVCVRAGFDLNMYFLLHIIIFKQCAFTANILFVCIYIFLCKKIINTKEICK